MSLTGRPSRPPLALISSSQICMPSSACLPLGASGPVSAIEKPILIGSPVGAWALAGLQTAAASAAPKNEAAMPRQLIRPIMFFLQLAVDVSSRGILDDPLV